MYHALGNLIVLKSGTMFFFSFMGAPTVAFDKSIHERMAEVCK